MKKKKWVLVFLTILIFPTQVQYAQSIFKVVDPELFRNPPDHTRPRRYWCWFDNHISKEGITHDLEAIKRVGIGGAFIGIIGGAIGPNIPRLPKPMSEPWWENLVHAVREGLRLEIDIGFFNSLE